MTNITNTHDLQKNKAELRRRYFSLSLGVLATLVAVVVATFAWYVYNTSTNTNKVHMVAGTSTKLEIASSYGGPYSSSISLGKFDGLLNAVSTNNITDGFWIMTEYKENEEGTKPKKVATGFKKLTQKGVEYYTSTVYIRTNALDQGVYACNIDYDKNDGSNLFATAVRVGFVVHEPGENMPVAQEYIFSISDEHNPNAEYNTYKGEDGWVLSPSGDVVPFSEYKPKNFIQFNKSTGVVTKTSDAIKLFDLTGTSDKKAGTPVQVDIYYWLEGCDADCTDEMGSGVMNNIAFTFVSYPNK